MWPFKSKTVPVRHFYKQVLECVDLIDGETLWVTPENAYELRQAIAAEIKFLPVTIYSLPWHWETIDGLILWFKVRSYDLVTSKIKRIGGTKTVMLEKPSAPADTLSEKIIHA